MFFKIPPLTISLLLFTMSIMEGQVSTFDTDYEGWLVSGDAQSGSIVPEYYPAGGNPGGYIYATDDNVGGVWYWNAPEKFLGDKCAAYDQFLSYDIKTTEPTPFFDSTDVILEGNGYRFVFQYNQTPGSNWTHYDIHLKEDAGWHVNHLNGPSPTAAEFQSMLSNVTLIRIRGEFIHGADAGSLDNVRIEGGLALDLDEDDSSGATGSNFFADTLCSDGASFIVDTDFYFDSDPVPDSIAITFFSGNVDGASEFFTGQGNPGISLTGNNSGSLTLINTDSADVTQIYDAVHTVEYHHEGGNLTGGLRIIQVVAYVGCASDTAFAYLRIITSGVAGVDTSLVLCEDADSISLTALMHITIPGGTWQPPLASGTEFYNPQLDPEGTFLYIIDGVDGCPGDSATVSISVTENPGLLIGADSLICADSLFTISPSDLTFDSYSWSTGQTTPVITVSSPGVYTLTVTEGLCTYSDSLVLNVYNCTDCRLYAPNVFSPNDDGINDRYWVFPNCTLLSFGIRIYDRWGEQVYESDNIEEGWNGIFRSKNASADVYAFYAWYEAESFGEVVSEFITGDIMLVR